MELKAEEGNSKPIKEIRFRILPTELYEEFISKVISANPELDRDAADRIIRAVNKKYDHPFTEQSSTDLPNKRFVKERKRLSALTELKLAREEEKIELERLMRSFDKAVEEVVQKTGNDPVEIRDAIDELLLNNCAQDLLEAQEILIEGPFAQGFDETSDPHISDKIVRQFLIDTFGRQVLYKARIGKVEKDDIYLIRLGENKSGQAEELVNQKQILTNGKNIYGNNNYIAKDKEHYQQAEMLLEGIDDPAKLKHLYKIRTNAGPEYVFWPLQLHSFGVERSQDFDYLTDLDLSEEDKIRAYILGTLAHEVAHRYESKLKIDFFTTFRQIIEEESIQTRNKYVSDYVSKQKPVYGADEYNCFREDFADTVRIYTTNPNWLKRNYPKRFAFIQENFPFIKPGGVIEAIKHIT